MPLRLLIPQLVQLAATMAMGGIIWMVQIVIYPLFLEVGFSAFEEYHRQYMALVTWVIAPLMFLEVASCVMCLLAHPKNRLLWIASILLGLIWLSTAFIQVPLHENLVQDQTEALVSSNWIRTIAWTARCIILMLVMMQLNQRAQKSLPLWQREAF